MSKKRSSSNYNILSYQILHYLLLLISTASLAGAQSNNGSSPTNPYGFNTNFNPSLAIIIVVLVSAFFFMGFFSIYIRQCAGDSRISGSGRPGTGRSRRGGAVGLEPSVIDTFPTFLYSSVKDLKIGKGALECAVCLSEFEDEETLRLLPKCDHVFHHECIDAWLASHITCPVCRANLSPDSTTTTATAADQNPDSDGGSSSEDESRAPETENRQNEHLTIRVVEGEAEDCGAPARNRSGKRRIRGKFPRSHSTGHSLVQPGVNCERFTLRLPEEVRKQIVSGKLSRVKSCVSFPVGEGSFSSRREGSSRGRSLQFWRTEQGARSDRWVFSMAPPFFSRASSLKSPKITDGEGGSSSAHGNSRNLLTSVKTPFDCIGSKGAGTSEESSSTRLPV